MRVAFVITRADEVGGAHIHVRYMSSWLKTKGMDVRVFVGGSGPFIDILEDASLCYSQLRYMKRPISPLKDIMAVNELASALAAFMPDIVTAHSAKAGLIARVACYLRGLPCIFTAHGWSFTEGVSGSASVIYKLIEKMAAPLAQMIITVSESDRALAIQCGIGPPGRIKTIYNGVPLIDDNNSTASSCLDMDSLTLVMVARFEKQKDHVTLINAMRLLQDLPWNLKLVGEGPLKQEAKILAQSYNLGDRIQFLGRREDVRVILSEADIFVLTTKWEGFPLSILEAMRAGLPVIATHVGGVPEAVQQGITGYLVPPQNPKAVSHFIKRLLESEGLRKEMGAKALERFLDEFTFESMACATLKLYTQVCSDYRIGRKR